MKIIISTPVHPTEDAPKLLESLKKYFPEIKFKVTKDKISGTTSDQLDLKLLRDRIMQKRVKNTVRYLMLEYRTPKGSRLMLNKQSLAVGKINFVEETYPLGNICVEVQTEELEPFLDYLTGMN